MRINETHFKKEIRLAFASALYPGDDNIVKAIEHYEVDDMNESFKGKRWRDISIKTAEDFRMSLMLFTDEGFRYFLPAFILAVFHKDSVDIDNYLIFSFIPPPDSSAYEQFSHRMNGFTEPQKSVIAKYVKLYFANNPLQNERDGKNTKNFWHIAE